MIIIYNCNMFTVQATDVSVCLQPISKCDGYFVGQILKLKKHDQSLNKSTEVVLVDIVAGNPY